MARYKIDGAKFGSMDELREALWPLYRDKMNREEFERYISENVEVID